MQECERHLQSTRLPGEQIADAYLTWMERQVGKDGVLLVAEIEGAFVGFVVGWIEQDDNVAETTDSNRFGYISDICVMPPYRGRRIAGQLLDGLERHLARTGIRRIRIGSLAANRSARTSYERAGFAPYEIVYEKIIPKDGRQINT